MDVRFLSHGIFLPQLDLWLDPIEDCANAWISHGHSDHARGCHGRVFATPDTLRIYRTRLPENTPDAQPVEYGVPWNLGSARLTAYPASHIVGAAQLLVEFEGERLLYTGDIKLRPPLCGPETQMVACDRLIIESTFGLPIIASSRAKQRVIAWPPSLGKRWNWAVSRPSSDIHWDGARRSSTFFARRAFPRQSMVPSRAISRSMKLPDTPSTDGRPIKVAMSAVKRWLRCRRSATFSKPAASVTGSPTYPAGQRSITLALASAPKKLIRYSDTPTVEELLALVDGTGACEVDVVHG